VSGEAACLQRHIQPLGGLSGIDQQTDCAGAGAAELYRGPGSGWLHKWRRSTPKGLLEPPGSTGHSAPWSWGRLDPATAPRARTAASAPRQRAPAHRPLPRERCAHDAAAPTPPAACPELGHSRSRGHAGAAGPGVMAAGRPRRSARWPAYRHLRPAGETAPPTATPAARGAPPAEQPQSTHTARSRHFPDLLGQDIKSNRPLVLGVLVHNQLGERILRRLPTREVGHANLLHRHSRPLIGFGKHSK
jgi:hypothetical protein